MKRNTLLQVIAALALPVIFYFIISGFKTGTNEVNTISLNTMPAINPPQYIQKDFVNFILNESYGHTNALCNDEGTNWQMENFLDKYRTELNFNGVHMYDFFDGSDCMGRFAQPMNGGQINKVQSLIDGAHNNGLKAIFMRSNLPDLCRAQRLVYEVTQPPGNHNTNYGFCYNTTAGKFETETDGTTSIHACVNPVDCQIEEQFDAIPQYICRNVYENMQHSDLPDWQMTELRPWNLKPRMKIRQQDFSPTDDRPVVTIEVIPFDGGAPIASKIIRIRNFKNNNQQYDGNYIDLFNFSDEPLGTNLEILGDKSSNGLNRGWVETDIEQNCRVDFKIYWHANVDVWFDKLTVDDERANKLFDPDPSINYTQYMDAELLNFGPNSDHPMDIFFADEVVHSMIPASKYVVEYVRNHSPSAKILIAYTNGLNVHGLRNNTLGFRPYLENYQPDYFQLDAHPIWGWREGWLTYDYHDNFYPDNIPDNYLDPKVPTGNGMQHLGWKVSKDEYTSSTQIYHFGSKTEKYDDEGTFIYKLRLARDQINQYSPNTRLIVQPQIQAWVKEFKVNGSYPGFYCEGHREPTNEEYEVQAMMSIAHGADGLSWFWFNSFDFEVFPNDVLPVNYMAGASPQMTPRPYKEWYYGLINPDASRRTQNMWGQNKWVGIGNTNKKILDWKQILDNSNWVSGSSVHSEGANYDYISDIQSLKQDNSQDPTNERYWEMGFYDPLLDGNFTRYFMMVNRRCVPDIPIGAGNGDFRHLKIKFNGSQLMTFENWSVVDVSTGQTVCTFPRLSSAFYDFGTFNPGEGRLYRIAPAIVKGGELAGDEIISDEEFTCEAPVYNNGHNITIGANTTIHFNDSSKFVMDGGVFTVGDQNTSGSQNITSDAVTGNTWKGHSFTNCEVNIYGATFTGLKNDTTYALNFIDCPVVDIRGCTFNTNSSLKGAINTVCYSNPFLAINNIYIGGNTFNSSGSTIPTVNVSSYAGITTPLIIENNTFNEGNTAIFLSGVTGGAIKDNIITDNYIGINALTSSIDIAENNISSSLFESIGIFSAGGSEIRLGKAGNLEIGGNNSITNTGERSNNIKVDGSYFLLADGENIFDIASNQAANHLTGYFPYFTAVSYDEHDNCFKVDNTPVNPPVNYVTDGYQGSAITFTFTPYLTGCEVSQCEDYIVVNLGGGVNDTICNGPMGTGGGNSGSQRHAFDLHFAKEKYDSLCVLIRYRNYSQAKTKCLDLINTYPDSIQSLNAVSKLFLATVAVDTSYNAANELKTYYENLILNHGSNVSLVKRVNYYILKCKVRMREYSQALAGFQQIINLNPYSYEGLIARWDYMATSLLIQGQSGGESGISDLRLGNADLDDESSIDIVNALQKEDDKGPFTKEQRKDIRKSINTAIEISKSDDETKMKTLEEKSQLGDVNASRELVQLKTLKQVVKTEKPKSILEHVKIVSEDIRKVFGSNTSSKGNEPKNIPSVFRLSQNYPNPFNPTTKINYDLPRDSKVNIVIYDILGREVKRLVSNELKTAGSYIIDFNASNYASGVYFYRIEAEEPNGNKFVDSKKMVLMK